MRINKVIFPIVILCLIQSCSIRTKKANDFMSDYEEATITYLNLFNELSDYIVPAFDDFFKHRKYPCEQDLVLMKELADSVTNEYPILWHGLNNLKEIDEDINLVQITKEYYGAINNTVIYMNRLAELFEQNASVNEIESFLRDDYNPIFKQHSELLKKHKEARSKFDLKYAL